MSLPPSPAAASPSGAPKPAQLEDERACDADTIGAPGGRQERAAGRGRREGPARRDASPARPSARQGGQVPGGPEAGGEAHGHIAPCPAARRTAGRRPSCTAPAGTAPAPPPPPCSPPGRPPPSGGSPPAMAPPGHGPPPPPAPAGRRAAGPGRPGRPCPRPRPPVARGVCGRRRSGQERASRGEREGEGADAARSGKFRPQVHARLRWRWLKTVCAARKGMQGAPSRGRCTRSASPRRSVGRPCALRTTGRRRPHTLISPPPSTGSTPRGRTGRPLCPRRACPACRGGTCGP